MRFKYAALALGIGALSASSILAQHKDRSVRRIDQCLVILMENHHYSQIIGSTNAPFINSYANSANLATNYYAVGHPSLTNYLEIVGGSNFGVLNDDPPDWHNRNCTPNIESGTTATKLPRPIPAPLPEQARTQPHPPSTPPMKALQKSRFTTIPSRRTDARNQHCGSTRRSRQDLEVLSGKLAPLRRRWSQRQ